MTHRRNFLTGIAGLIVAPAVVRAEALMPIVVWRPTFWHTRNVGMGPFLSCRADYVVGVYFLIVWIAEARHVLWLARATVLVLLAASARKLAAKPDQDCPPRPRNAALAAPTNHPK